MYPSLRNLVVSPCTNETNVAHSSGRSGDTLLVRALHILTLAVHVFGTAEDASVSNDLHGAGIGSLRRDVSSEGAASGKSVARAGTTLDRVYGRELSGVARDCVAKAR